MDALSGTGGVVDVGDLRQAGPRRPGERSRLHRPLRRSWPIGQLRRRSAVRRAESLLPHQCYGRARDLRQLLLIQWCQLQKLREVASLVVVCCLARFEARRGNGRPQGWWPPQNGGSPSTCVPPRNCSMPLPPV